MFDPFDFNLLNPPRYHDNTAEICDRLNRRIVDLALALGFERDASSTATDKRFGKNGHLSIKPEKALWRDHRAHDGGDALELVRYALGYPPKDREGKNAAFEWAKQWLGIDGSNTTAPASRPGSQPASRRAAEVAAQASVDEALIRARNRYRAQVIYDQAFPCLQSNPCEKYLRRRGIWMAARHTPLRWTKLDHPHTREPGLDALVVPLVQPGTQKVCGVQRIFLRPDGTKYERGKAKLSLGDSGVAMLHAPGQRLVLAEGLESALSASVLYDRPCWCFCSGFPPTVILPDHVRDVIIAADHDTPFDHRGKPKVTSLMKATELARFVLHSGRASTIEMPDQPGLDANDVLLAKKEAA
jgi:hypothetical protein